MKENYTDNKTFEHNKTPCLSLGLARSFAPSPSIWNKPLQYRFASLDIKCHLESAGWFDCRTPVLNLQSFWLFHKESNDVRTFWTGCNTLLSGWRAPKNRGWNSVRRDATINYNCLTLFHIFPLSSLQSASLRQRGHILKPLATRLPDVHQQKTIN